LTLVAVFPAGIFPPQSAGPSRQFANLCGVVFSGAAWACLFGEKALGARIMLVCAAV